MIRLLREKYFPSGSVLEAKKEWIFILAVEFQDQVNFQLTWAHELLTTDGRYWSEDLIHSIFTQASNKAILEMKGLNLTPKTNESTHSDNPGSSSSMQRDKKA
ncbi:DNA-directed RNA polymerase subunit beta [Striga asiatica]|uniref:DNA-directed RNA polymerase subunit beta n=1 Tax=Striga asiatica TaxID=4170 RepID=A0A5A7PDK3_STRAF|nr:DNA-directed RNA polymerase subunit beta [Striga asiatica]